MGIKRFAESCMEGGGVAPSAHGEYVEYADHIASHAYDEAKERELFEAHMKESHPNMSLNICKAEQGYIVSVGQYYDMDDPYQEELMMSDSDND